METRVEVKFDALINGYGLYSKLHFSPGEVILNEMSIFSAPQASFPSLEHRISYYIDQFVKSSSAVQCKLMSLYCHSNLFLSKHKP
jgi:hypothetical protein